jgi:predicted metal-dependent HD superfamily phosphohydrolase
MTIPYTRLYGTDLWKAAKKQYDSNGHPYHALSHVVDLYSHAERLYFDYDAELDHAILAHDVILDGLPDPEIRSGVWLRNMAGDSHSRAVQLIHTTIDHRPCSDDNRLALIDLMNFTSPDMRRRDTRLLRDEAAIRARGDFDQKAWVHGTLGYLNGLVGRISEDLESGEEIAYRPLWNRIRHGIRCTMSTLPMNYAPHPAQGIQRYTRDQEAILLRLNEGPMTQEMLLDFCRGEEIDSSRISGLVTRLKDEDLAAPTRRIDFPTIAITEEGRSWCEKINAPHEDWQEPEL